MTMEFTAAKRTNNMEIEPPQEEIDLQSRICRNFWNINGEFELPSLEEGSNNFKIEGSMS